MKNANQDRSAIKKTFPTLFLNEHLELLKGRIFRRMALISSLKHIQALSPLDPDTLLVCCDWLVWQRAMSEGLESIHYEAGLTGEDPKKLMSNLYITSNDWIYVDGIDVTRFRNISLGRKFFKETSLVIFEYTKIQQTLKSLINQFEPKEIIFFDYRTDLAFLSQDTRFDIASKIAAEGRCTIEDKRGIGGSSEESLSLQASYRVSFGKKNKPLQGLRSGGMRLLEAFMEILTGLIKDCASPKLNVLMLTTHLTAIPLLRAKKWFDIRPIFIGTNFPNKRKTGFLLSAILKGVQLAARPKVKLSEADKKALKKIILKLETAELTAPNNSDKYVRSYVRNHIINNGRLHKMAKTVLWADLLLSRHKPDRVVTDGLQNATYCTFLELAQNRRIPTAITWHGHYLIDMKLETTGGDSRVRPLAGYSLSWGKIQEEWLNNTNAKSHSIITGNPISAQYMSHRRENSRKKNVLVLQYTPLLQDLHASQSKAFTYFVETVLMLSELGYNEICFRLHPGHARIEYYNEVADRFGLKCTISDSGSFLEVLKPAEFAIGPVTTGAMFEVLGMGKDYYPVLFEPHSLNLTYLRNGEISKSIPALREAILGQRALKQEVLLNDFTSSHDIPNAAEATWQSIKENMNGISAR